MTILEYIFAIICVLYLFFLSLVPLMVFIGILHFAYYYKLDLPKMKEDNEISVDKVNFKPRIEL